MTENLKNLSSSCAALGIKLENLPDSEHLADLVACIRRDFSYQGLDLVPREQMTLLSEASGYLVPVIDDQDILAVFRSLNAFDIDTAEAEARVAVRRKLDSIESSSGEYCEGFARLMVEAIQRGLRIRGEFGVNDVLIYQKLEQLAFIRGVCVFGDRPLV